MLLENLGTETAFAGLSSAVLLFYLCLPQANTDRPCADGKSFEAVPAESSRLAKSESGRDFVRQGTDS